MINKVILIGNLGRDPEVRRLENGAVVAKFSVATNENWRDKNGEWQKSTEWHEVVAWRHLAERAERDLKKGKQVFVEGKLTHRKYQDKEGNDKYITEVVASTLRLLERRENTEGDTDNNYMPSQEPTATVTSTNPSASEAAEPAKTTEAADDDLPF